MSNVPQPANYQEIADSLDEQIASGNLTMEQALRSAQASGLTTGPGGYEPKGWHESEVARLNRESEQSAKRSAAYQAQAGDAGNNEADQEAINVEHPLSEN
jgi:hypothetical protein